MTSLKRTGLIFGTAGAPVNSEQPTPEAGIERVAELGLGCMEVQSVRGVNMGDGEATQDICESPDREGDALPLQETYGSL